MLRSSHQTMPVAELTRGRPRPRIHVTHNVLMSRWPCSHVSMMPAFAREFWLVVWHAVHVWRKWMRTLPMLRRSDHSMPVAKLGRGQHRPQIHAAPNALISVRPTYRVPIRLASVRQFWLVVRHAVHVWRPWTWLLLLLRSSHQTMPNAEPGRCRQRPRILVNPIALMSRRPTSHVSMTPAFAPGFWLVVWHAVHVWRKWMRTLPMLRVIASDYASCKAGTGPIQTPDSCDRQCSNVGSAYLSCSDNACFCPTILASGLACSSCLVTLDGDPSDAATIASDYIGCNGTLPSTQPITASLFTLSTTMPASANPTSTSKSGARVFTAEVFGAGYIQMIMLIAMVAGLFSVFF